MTTIELHAAPVADPDATVADLPWLPAAARRDGRPRCELLLAVAEHLSLVVGVVCLLIVGGVWLEARWFQAVAARQLAAPAPVAASGPPRARGEVVVPPARPAPGTPLATLDIPRLGLRAVVAEGASGEVLRRALGHLDASSRPGFRGNVVVAGHRDTLFRPLEDIRPGDLIRLHLPWGRVDYAVEWTRVVAPDEVAVAGATSYDALTLVTCYPFRWVGGAPQRFVVRARFLPPTAAGTS